MWGLFRARAVQARRFTVVEACILGEDYKFANHPVKGRCSVLIVAAEAPHQIRRRLVAAVKAKVKPFYEVRGMRAPEHLPIYWVEEVPNLTSPGGFAQLQSIMQRVQKRSQCDHGLDLGVVFIDTVSAAADFDQDNTKESNALLNGLHGIKGDCAVTLVDHFGKNIEAGTKGNSAKEQRADAVWYCIQNKKGYELFVKKMRDAESGFSIYYHLDDFDMGTVDEDGDPDISKIINYVEGVAVSTMPTDDGFYNRFDKPKIGRPPESTDHLVAIMNDLLTTPGVSEFRDTRVGRVNTVTKDQLLAKFVELTLTGDPQKEEAQAKRRFDYAFNLPDTKRYVAFEKFKGAPTLVWLTHPDVE